MACRANAIAVALAFCAIAASIDLKEAEYESLWTQYVKQFAKQYHPHEVANKYVVFKDNVDFIQDHNQNHAARLGYKVGINEFADMTNAEFKRAFTGLNSLQKKKQNSIVLLDQATSPASVDWTTKNAVTPVKNQGQCGSCWAFSTTGSVEGINAIKTGKLQSFSEQELVSCAGSYGNQGCNGGLMDDGFEYIMAKGDVLEKNYPYTGKTGTCSASKTSHVAVKIDGYKDVSANNEAQLKAAVAQQPVSVAIEADQSGFQFYKSGVFSGKCGTNLDHGVLAVGYGTDNGQGYWKVKNSWGASWGQNGYILMARNIKSSKGQCGIAMQPSYPTMGSTALASSGVPSGTYSGEKDILGEDIKASVTIDDATHLDLQISGAVSVDCKQESYSLSGATVTVPGATQSGDCIHDALNGKATLEGITYDSSADTITVKVKKIITISFVLKKSSALRKKTARLSAVFPLYH